PAPPAPYTLSLHDALPISEIIDTLEIERHYKDGTVIGTAADIGVGDRRKLSFAGHVAVSLVLDKKGAQIADPDIELTGVPIRSRSEEHTSELQSRENLVCR